MACQQHESKLPCSGNLSETSFSAFHRKTKTEFFSLKSLPEVPTSSLDDGGCLRCSIPCVKHCSSSPQKWAEHCSEHTLSVRTGLSSGVTGLGWRNLDTLHRRPLLMGSTRGTGLHQITPSDEVNLE